MNLKSHLGTSRKILIAGVVSRGKLTCRIIVGYYRVVFNHSPTNRRESFFSP
jgi:hypothetical protein